MVAVSADRFLNSNDFDNLESSSISLIKDW
jgi:hypothetical protein